MIYAKPEQVDYFVAETRGRMAVDDYVRLGPAEKMRQVGALGERLTSVGVDVRYDWDHDKDDREPGDDGPGEKKLFAWIPRWVAILVVGAARGAGSPLGLDGIAHTNVKVGPRTRRALRALLESEDQRRALLTSFDAGGVEAAFSYAFDGGLTDD